MEIPFAKRNNKMVEASKMPQVSMPTRPATNEKHAEALTAITNMASDNEQLRARVTKLEHDLEVAVALGHEFKRLHDLKQEELIKAITYSTEAMTYFQSIYDLARRAHEQSKNLSLHPPKPEEKLTPEQAKQLIHGVEEDLKVKEIGKKFGANNLTEEHKAMLAEQNVGAKNKWADEEKVEDK